MPPGMTGRHAPFTLLQIEFLLKLVFLLRKDLLRLEVCRERARRDHFSRICVSAGPRRGASRTRPSPCAQRMGLLLHAQL